MRTVFIYCISAVWIAALARAGGSQGGEDLRSFQLQGVTLRASLDSLMCWYSVSIVFFDKDVEEKTVSAVCDGCTVGEAMTKVLSGTSLVWMRNGDQIVVRKGEPRQDQRWTTVFAMVVDSATGERMAGASVRAVNAAVGGATNLDGSVLLRNVPPGNQRLKVTYIGYQPLSVDIDVPARGTLERILRIVPRPLIGDTVLVTALVQSQTADINQQLSSNTIKNVVSEKRIHELPDFNAAEAVGRLPGVSLQRSAGEGYKVIIRGLSSQHNLVAVNGVQLPSAGNADRSVDLSMITPQMLRAIEVFKTLTPDVEGDAIGGYVNMALQEAPSGLHSDLSWQSVYTRYNRQYGSYKATGTISDRFSRDRLGVFALGSIEKVDRNADNYQGSYSLQGESLPGQAFAPVYLDSMQVARHREERTRYCADIVLDYTMPGSKLVFFSFLTRMDQDYTEFSTTRDLVQQVCDFTLSKGRRNVDELTSAFQGNQDFGVMSVGYSVSGTYARTADPSAYSYTFRQENAFPASFSPVNAQPEAAVANTLTDLRETYLNTIGKQSSSYKESAQAYALHVAVPVDLFSSGSAQVKVGGRYQRMSHDNDENALVASMANPGDQWLRSLVQKELPQLNLPAPDPSAPGRLYAPFFTNPDASSWGSSLDARFGNLVWTPSPGKMDLIGNFIDGRKDSLFESHAAWIAGPVQSLANDFHYQETNGAFYVMGQVDLGSAWMFLGGARYEDVDWSFEAYQMQDQNAPRTQPYKKVTVPGVDRNILPMVQLKYKPLAWLDVRYAYTKTLSRADFTALTPRVFMDNLSRVVSAGNPHLIPAESYNHDLIVSTYTEQAGLLTIGVFYKTIDHLVWNTSYYLPAVPVPGFFSVKDFPGSNPGTYLITFANNSHPAYIGGLEGDWQAHLWYLPFPLNGLVLDVNYTHTWSTTAYPIVKTLTTYDAVRAQVATVYVDSARVGRLQDQPADVLNASLGYDFEGFSGRVSIAYTGSTLRSIGTRPETDSETSEFLRVDVSMKQRLPWENLHLYVNMNNINNSSDQAAQRTLGAPTLRQYYGFAVDVGVRWML